MIAAGVAKDGRNLFVGQFRPTPWAQAAAARLRLKTSKLLTVLLQCHTIIARKAIFDTSADWKNEPDGAGQYVLRPRWSRFWNQYAICSTAACSRSSGSGVWPGFGLGRVWCRGGAAVCCGALIRPITDSSHISNLSFVPRLFCRLQPFSKASLDSRHQAISEGAPFCVSTKASK